MIGSCEHGNEPSDSIKGGEFLNQLSICQLLRKDLTPWSLIILLQLCIDLCVTHVKAVQLPKTIIKYNLPS
jgi:hypothetical protein